MKRILKITTTICLAVFIIFGFTACGVPLSSTKVDDSKSIVNKVSTNGGTTAIYDNYLYFINGTKTNNGTSSRGTTQGAICRVKYDVDAGKVEENAEVELVVSDLVGFEDGSINIFGDFLYYTTPNADVNYTGAALNYKTEFKRYDLVYGNSYTLYTTHLNNSSEVAEYAYYVVADELYLVVYEKVAKTITSLKISDNTTIVYRINDVVSCVMSDNFGKRINEDITDANDFVFYTKAPSIEVDGYDEGAKVFKTSPNKDNSKWMGNKDAGEDAGEIKHKHNIVKILSVKNGKLIYTDESIIGETFIYAQSIGENTNLEFNEEDIISRKAYNGTDDIILFNELANGEISILAYNATSHSIVCIEKDSAENDPYPDPIINFGKKTDVDFVGTVQTKIVEKNDDGEVVKTEIIEYLLYTVTESSKVTLYKIEIKRNGVISTSQNLEVVVSSDDGMVSLNGLIMPEAIGNNLFVMVEVKDEDKNSEGNYLHIIDISKKVDKEDNKLTIIKK